MGGGLGPSRLLWSGLDAAAAQAALALAGIELGPGHWEWLQMIAAGASAALNEER